MSNDLLVARDRLDYLIRSSPQRYKVYKVPKRSGSGMRTIAQPAKEVKALQYWVIKNVFPLMPIHPSATAYISGQNIRNNAEPHAKSPYFLKLDFIEFFPSIKALDFASYIKGIDTLHIEPADQERLMRILFWRPKGVSELRLSIGAPSSPYLSNALMHRFDTEIDQFSVLHRIRYTRYADDMTFSMEKKDLRGIMLNEVGRVLASLPFPRLEINTKKTVFGSKAHRRMVTGLILSNEGLVSLGRDKKRRISAQIHNFAHDNLSENQKAALRGMLAFARNIEPEFIGRMVRKYGAKVVDGI